MTDIKTPTWADVRKIADDLKEKMHSASEAAKDRWAKLQPSLHEAQEEVSKGGAVVATKLVHILGSLKEIGKDVAHKLDLITHEPGTKGEPVLKSVPPADGAPPTPTEPPTKS
ncbi:MAG: hypothetical protein H0T42_13965 [Deltaproteobacteria bacterium]|nr:hypothetical protein [Deltaproteobacteria bacterium]